MSNENLLSSPVSSHSVKGRNNTSNASAKPKQSDNTPCFSQLTTNENSRSSSNYFSFLKIKSSPSHSVQKYMITYNSLNMYNSTPDKYNTKVMTKLVEKIPSHVYSIIKDLELDQDDTDHINTYYPLDKSSQLLRKILDYYEIFSLRMPTFQYLPLSNPIQEYHFWWKKHLEDLEFGNTHDEASKTYFRSISNSFIETDNGRTNIRHGSEFNFEIPEDSFLNSRQKCSFTTLMRRESGGGNYRTSILNSSVASFKLGAKHLEKRSQMHPKDYNLMDSISVILNSNMKTVSNKTFKNDEDISMISSQILLHLNSKRTSLARIPDPFELNSELINSSNTLTSPKVDQKINTSSKEKTNNRKKSLHENKSKEAINFPGKSKGHNNTKSEARQLLKTPLPPQTVNLLITKEKDKNQVKELATTTKPTSNTNIIKSNNITSANPQISSQPGELKVKSKNVSKTGQVLIKESKTAAPTPSNLSSKKIELTIPSKKDKSSKNVHKGSTSANPTLNSHPATTTNQVAGIIPNKTKLPQSFSSASATPANDQQKKTLTKQKSQAGLTKKTCIAKSGQRSKSGSLEKNPKKYVGSFHEATRIDYQGILPSSSNNIQLKTKIVNLWKDMKEPNESLSKKLFQNPNKQIVRSDKQSQSRPLSKNRVSTSGKISKEKNAAEKLTHNKSSACIVKPKLLKAEKQILDLTKKMDESLERIIDEEQDDGQMYPSGRKTEVTRNLIKTFDNMAAKNPSNLFKPYDTENDRTEANCPFPAISKKEKEHKHKVSQTITSISNLKTAKIIDKSNSCKKSKEIKDGVVLSPQALNSTTAALNSTNALSKTKKSAV